MSIISRIKNKWLSWGLKAAISASPKQAKSTNTVSNTFSLRIQRAERAVTGLTLTDWEDATNAAVAVKGKRLLLTNLYEYCLRDLHTQSEVSFRINRIVGEKWLIKRKENEDLEAEKLLNKEWFRKVLIYAMQSLFHGHSLIEITDFQENEIRRVELIPRQHVNPITGQVLMKPGDGEGMPYRGAPMLWEVGSVFDLGLLKDISNHCIRKLFVEQYWLDFSARFGLPIPYATVDTKDEPTLEQIDLFLESMSSGDYARFPSGVKIDLIQPNNTDSFNIFAKYIELKEKHISKLILGQTQLTNDNTQSGSYGKSKVSQEVADEIRNADKFFLQNFVNEQVLPLLITLGYPLQDCSFEWDELAKLPIAEQFAIDKGLMELGYQLDDDYIQTTYHVKLKNVKGGQTRLMNANFYQPLPSATDRGYNLRNSTNPANVKNEDSPLFQKFQKLAKKLHKDGEVGFDAAYQAFLKEMAAFYDKDVSDSYQQEVETAYDLADVKQLAFMKNNLFVFSGAKVEDELKVMKDLLLDENGKERSLNDFMDAVQAVHADYNMRYLETEHQHVIASAQMGAKWQDIQRTKDTFPWLQYDAVNDKHTRAAHKALDGFTAKADDAIWNTIYPPNGWNCRCLVRKLRTGVRTAGSPDTKDIAEMFQNNVGENGIIFPDTHPYFEAAPKKQAWTNDILHILDDMSYIPFSNNGKNTIEVHSRFNPEEWEDNLQFAQELQANEYNVRINKYLNANEWSSEVPKDERKNPDAHIYDNDKWLLCDFKAPEGKSISNSLQGANEQKCEAVVIRLTSKITKQSVIETLKSRNELDKNLKRIYFVHPDGKVYAFDKKGISDKIAELPNWK